MQKMFVLDFSAAVAGGFLFRKVFFLICFLIISGTASFAQTKNVVEDVFEPLPAGRVKLSGAFDEDIRKMHDNWNRQTLPYARLADFFRIGRPQFAVGEMWGKAVRSSSLLYRYTQDPELKKILEATVADMLTTQQFL